MKRINARTTHNALSTLPLSGRSCSSFMSSVVTFRLRSHPQCTRTESFRLLHRTSCGNGGPYVTGSLGEWGHDPRLGLRWKQSAVDIFYRRPQNSSLCCLSVTARDQRVLVSPAVTVYPAPYLLDMCVGMGKTGIPRVPWDSCNSACVKLC